MRTYKYTGFIICCITGIVMFSCMILQVQDELIFDATKEEADDLMKKVKELMSQVMEIDVPMDVDANTGDNWLQAH